MAPPRDDVELCRRLRWKGMFVETERDPTVPEATDGFCWCARTAGSLGPDGRVAEPGSCRPGRACFERA